jgi:L-alanine-DL-glutamate epimerase-like enolase superfamily enzyme
MSIQLTAAVYQVPTDIPEADGTLNWDRTTLIVVHATSDGVTGLGYTYGPQATATAVANMLAPVVANQEPDDVPATWMAMRRRVRNAGRSGIAAMAISAADCALWDLKARRHNLSLVRLLGAARHQVPVYGSGGFTTYTLEHEREQLSRWVHEDGIQRVKIKIGEDFGERPDRDLRRMAAARTTIGDQVQLFVDANGAYTRKQAIRLIQSAADLDIAWYEEPVSSDDLKGLGIVRDHVLPDVAAGEYGCDLPYFTRMAPVVDCLQVDVTRCGGITVFLRAAALAAAHELDVSSHCAPHQHLAVAAAVPNLRHMEWFHDHVLIESKLFDGAVSPTGGTATPDPDAPGNGLHLRDADAQRYRLTT